MLALAIVLLVLVALLVVVSFVSRSDEIVIEFLNVTITTSVGQVFITGVIGGLVALASLVSVKRSLRRRRARSKEVQELRRKAAAITTPRPDDTIPAEAAESTPATAVLDTESGQRTTIGDQSSSDADPPRS